MAGAPTSAWHSAASDVYHDHQDCFTGMNELALRKDVELGDGGKPQCSECCQLSIFGDMEINLFDDDPANFR